MGMFAWSVLLAIEGPRRRIPGTWAYLGLAHLVSLSFAQNLFFIALLLRPTPIIATGDEVLPASRFAISSSFFPRGPNMR